MENALIETQKKFQSIQDVLKMNQTKVVDKLKTAETTNKQNEAIDIDTVRHNINNSPSQSNGNESNYNRQIYIERKRKTLIIGDSILKGIQTRGLNHDVIVKTLRGKKVKDVFDVLRSNSNLQRSSHKLQDRQERGSNLLDDVRTVVLYVGGNDVASGKSATTVGSEYSDLVSYLQQKGCDVKVCTVCPRKDVDVERLNEELANMAEETNAQLIDCGRSFVTGNGLAVPIFYMRDGIHLSKLGTSNLLRLINTAVVILKARDYSTLPARPTQNVQDTGYRYDSRYSAWQQTDYRSSDRQKPWCNICGLTNHETRFCRRARW